MHCQEPSETIYFTCPADSEEPQAKSCKYLPRVGAATDKNRESVAWTRYTRNRKICGFDSRPLGILFTLCAFDILASEAIVAETVTAGLHG